MNFIDRSIYKNFSPLPEDLQGWNGNSELFSNLVFEKRPHTIIEVGSWKGQSAICMGKNVKKFGLNTRIYCVDTWLGSVEFWTDMRDTPERNLLLKNGYPQVFFQFLSNVVHNHLEDVIFPLPNTSDNNYRYFKYFNISADLIYIDASHEEEDVYNDVKNYYNLLNKNGIIFGDDYNVWIGVKNSVNRFVNENSLTLEIIENNYWVIRT